MQRDSFVSYRSFYESVKDFDKETIADIYIAINEFALNHNEVELTGVAKAIFTLIKPQLEASYMKAVSGSKGGRVSKSQSSEELEDKDKQNSSKPQANHKQNVSKVQAMRNANANANANANEKCKYGEHSHVLLTNSERLKLDEEYPNAKELIQFLDDYIDDKPKYGKEHKSHYRCIKTWVVDAVNEHSNKKKDIQVNYDDSRNNGLSDAELKALQEFRDEK